MKAGRELDALIAEKVIDKSFFIKDIPYYSTDISAAWEVAEKLQGEEAMVSLDCHSFAIRGIKYHVVVHRDIFQRFEIWADTAPLAICLAALKAVGFEP